MACGIAKMLYSHQCENTIEIEFEFSCVCPCFLFTIRAEECSRRLEVRLLQSDLSGLENRPWKRRASVACRKNLHTGEGVSLYQYLAYFLCVVGACLCVCMRVRERIICALEPFPKSSFCCACMYVKTYPKLMDTILHPSLSQWTATRAARNHITTWRRRRRSKRGARTSVGKNHSVLEGREFITFDVPCI